MSVDRVSIRLKSINLSLHVTIRREVDMFKVATPRRMGDLPPSGLRDQMADVPIINVLT